MKRCLQLAALGAGKVAPNPMVGSVLVYQNRIIGEGYHEQYGQAHAEVNCLAAVKEEDRLLIPESTLYVSLEPCAHFGKTPPCADLIIRSGIKKVVVAIRDPFDAVDGKGIEKLQESGVEVILGVEQEAAREVNKRFLQFHETHRPYIILKWAESVNGAIATNEKKPAAISSAQTNRLVHQWRAEEAAILVGATTALMDDPSLTVRLVAGKNPVRLLIDPELRVPRTNRLFSAEAPTIIFNYHQSGKEEGIEWVQLDRQTPLLDQLLEDVYKRKLLSILVEGGAKTHQEFMTAGYWDEIRRIQSRSVVLEGGYPAPVITDARELKSCSLGTDQLIYYRP
ncbi:bifunctional diaminohydroxyphosphoribosylaminopyrimidine deaminase/5-amino-6-(5-phosphoribosylamino)uracil reductase RibD [Flavihumibacter sp. RY-1]|uniref:Riboflavin biosynthesis protein RibD n=2 Tax=Flavihumibacter fluminis TaxID=2909236 RepID=A0ABS9BFR4_9BACT|nr:bifunctional diaminohydroxyphosphoribosylaminopyrimidine deaminase/5-amino-6-(5-phosphoribosylamino)uracil reductase RibD [Flavihumibacter fluminis]